MSDQPNPTAPAESPDRDVAVGGALRYFLGAKRWRPSDLAKAAGMPVAVLHPVVTGYTPSIATLRHLCKLLEVDLWVFFMIGELLNEEDPAASLAAGIDRLKAASEDILISAEEGWLDERSMDRREFDPAGADFSSFAARRVPEELLRLAERLARVRLRLAQLACLVNVDETTAEWNQMVESEVPPSVAFLLSADLNELAGHLEDVERFLRETAFIPTTGPPRTTPDIQAELLRLLAPEVSSVKVGLQVLWREIEQSRGETSPLRDLARAFASGYAEGSFSIADSLDEAEESLREDSCITDGDLAREFHKERRRLSDRKSGP